MPPGTVRIFPNHHIPHSSVSIKSVTRYDGPIVLLAMEVTVEREHRFTKARYDLDKRIFIDAFDDEQVTYQLRRVELTLGDLLDNGTFDCP